MRAIVLLNAAAGRCAGDGAVLRDAVATALANAGIDADIRSISHRSLAQEAPRAAKCGADAIIAGGGDGTVSTVAGVLAGQEIPLGVLPLGTLNHFAKDLGVPMSLPEAAAVIRKGNIGEVDLGSVNGRTFINNSSIGAYPRAVLNREFRRSRFGLGKWPAMFLAVLKTFRRFPLVSVRIETPDRTIRRKSPLVFIGNNEYQLELLNVGGRKCLDAARLALYVANTQTRWGMFKLTLRAILGRLNQARDFESTCLEECWIETRRRRLHVALDGEVIKLTPPLHYQIRPGALRVLLPPETTVALIGDDEHQQPATTSASRS